jgi:hypothetical protein
MRRINPAIVILTSFRDSHLLASHHVRELNDIDVTASPELLFLGGIHLIERVQMDSVRRTPPNFSGSFHQEFDLHLRFSHGKT